MSIKVHPHGEQISAYLDGMLDVAQMHDMAAHLAVCPQCRLSQQELRQTKNLLASINAPQQPSAEFWASAYRRIRVERPRHASWINWQALHDGWQIPQRRWSIGVAVIAFATAAICGPVLMHEQTLSSQPVRAIASAAPDSVDVSFLVQAHTESAAHQPLGDTDRQDMIAMDDSFAANRRPSSARSLSDTGHDAFP